MPPNVLGLKDVNEAVRPAAASPRKSPAEELADALQLGAYAAEDQKNERWKDARRGFLAAHSALQRLIQEQPDMSEAKKISLRQTADRYWESATSAGQALRQAVDALSNPTPTPPEVCIVLPNGTDDASRDKVLGAVVKVLATKGFAVEVSSWARDVFILSAESAPRIEELLHPALPHRIKGVDVIFHARCAFPRRDASALEDAPDAGELIPGCGEKGHQLASDRPAPENPEDMRAKRIAALGQRQAATPNSWVIDLLPRAKAGAPPNAGC